MYQLAKKYDTLFKLSDEVGDFKKEEGYVCEVNKGLFVSHEIAHFNKYLKGGEKLEMVSHPQIPRRQMTTNVKIRPWQVMDGSARKVGYQQFNLVSGEAGTGKTIQFFEKFGDVNNRLGNVT